MAWSRTVRRRVGVTLAVLVVVVVGVLAAYPAVEMWYLRQLIQHKENFSSARAIRRLVKKGAKGVPILFDEACTGVPAGTIDIGARERNGIVQIGRDALPYLRRQLREPGWRRPLNAAYCIAMIAPEDDAGPDTFLRLVSGDDQQAQVQALLTVGVLEPAGRPWRLEVFRTALAHGEGSVKTRAIDLLEAAGEPLGDEALLALLDEPHDRLRIMAAAALLQRGDRAGVEHLIALLDGPINELTVYTVKRLNAATGQRFGFSLVGTVEGNEEALRKWIAYLRGEEPDGDVEPPETEGEAEDEDVGPEPGDVGPEPGDTEEDPAD